MTLAEAHDGLFTSKHARDAGFTESVLVRLAQRDRTASRVYRIRWKLAGIEDFRDLMVNRL